MINVMCFWFTMSTTKPYQRGRCPWRMKLASKVLDDNFFISIWIFSVQFNHIWSANDDIFLQFLTHLFHRWNIKSIIIFLAFSPRELWDSFMGVRKRLWATPVFLKRSQWSDQSSSLQDLVVCQWTHTPSFQTKWLFHSNIEVVTK